MNIIQKIKLNNPEKENLQKTLYEIDTLSKRWTGGGHAFLPSLHDRAVALHRPRDRRAGRRHRLCKSKR